MRKSVSTPRRSCPDDFKAAQSSGPYPGASATFLEGFLGRSVVANGASKDDDAIWGFACGTPGCRLARSGRGGGGINVLSLRIVGMLCGAEAARWALLSAGNAGGTSSSPAVLEPSSSSGNDPGMVALVAIFHR